MKTFKTLLYLTLILLLSTIVIFSQSNSSQKDQQVQQNNTCCEKSNIQKLTNTGCEKFTSSSEKEIKKSTSTHNHTKDKIKSTDCCTEKQDTMNKKHQKECCSKYTDKDKNECPEKNDIKNKKQ